MLAFKPQKRYKYRRTRDQTQWPTTINEEEMAFAQPSPPIPVVLAADEEAAVEHDNAAMEDILESDHESEKDLPAPPPTYGNWRGSVVRLHILPTPTRNPQN